jgi:thymidylate kinase
MELESFKVCIDGVDCSGKTTLWNAIHKISNYRWKLEDRSFVTMVVYARHHGRKKANDYHRQLIRDVSNLNNKYVLINPKWDLVEKRFKVRGDDLHSLEDLKKIHSHYQDVINEVSKFPNVYVLDSSEDVLESAKKIASWLEDQENSSIDKIVDMIQKHAAASKNNETSPMTFSFVESGDFPEHDQRILDVNWVKERYPSIKPATVVEFNEMVDKFFQTVDDELKGNNIYNKPQSSTSRRFVFTQDACVSFMQAMHRDNMLKFYVSCRSSHVLDVFPADIRLIYHMCKGAYDRLGLEKGTRVLFEFTLNSAHTVV